MRAGEPTTPPRQNFRSSKAVMSNLRGRFLDGVWHCDCDPRLPAHHFQTKNHGVNHGRWFYTCQKPQHKRCKFFLWDDDAKQREKFAVLSNARSEPGQSENQHSERPDRPQTPTKNPTATTQNPSGLLTPQTGHRTIKSEFDDSLYSTPTKEPNRPRDGSEETDNAFGWDDDIYSEAERIFQQTPQQERRIQQPRFEPETPRKTPRTSKITSPGRAQRSSPPASEDVNPGRSPTKVGSNSQPLSPSQIYPRLPLSTPSVPFSDSQLSVGSGARSQHIPSSAELPSTPTPSRFADMSVPRYSPSDTTSLIALETLSILDRHNVVLPNRARDELIAHLDRYDLRTQGIIKGREVSRMALKKKDEQIRMLNARIEGLEAEKEMDRALITGLKTGSNQYGSQHGSQN